MVISEDLISTLGITIQYPDCNPCSLIFISLSFNDRRFNFAYMRTTHGNE